MLCCCLSCSTGGCVTAVDSLSVRCIGIASAVVHEGGMRVGKGKGYNHAPAANALPRPCCVLLALEFGVCVFTVRTRDLQVVGSSPLRSGLGQSTSTACLPSSPSSIIWYRPRGSDLFGWESNCGPGGK